MGRFIRRTLAILFFLGLAACIILIYLKMFMNPVADTTPKPVKPSGFTTMDSMTSSRGTPVTKSMPTTNTSIERTQESGIARSIEGTVTDFDSGSPISGFALILLGQETGYFAEAMTGPKGKFHFDGIPVEAGDSFILRTSQRDYYLPDSSERCAE